MAGRRDRPAGTQLFVPGFVSDDVQAAIDRGDTDVTEFDMQQTEFAGWDAMDHADMNVYFDQQQDFFSGPPRKVRKGPDRPQGTRLWVPGYLDDETQSYLDQQNLGLAPLVVAGGAKILGGLIKSSAAGPNQAAPAAVLPLAMGGNLAAAAAIMTRSGIQTVSSAAPWKAALAQLQAVHPEYVQAAAPFNGAQGWARYGAIAPQSVVMAVSGINAIMYRPPVQVVKPGTPGAPAAPAAPTWGLPARPPAQLPSGGSGGGGVAYVPQPPPILTVDPATGYPVPAAPDSGYPSPSPAPDNTPRPGAGLMDMFSGQGPAAKLGLIVAAVLVGKELLGGGSRRRRRR